MEEKKRQSVRTVMFLSVKRHSTDTYVDQSEVVFVNGKLFRSNLLFQGRGIGALETEEEVEGKHLFWMFNVIPHVSSLPKQQ